MVTTGNAFPRGTMTTDHHRPRRPVSRRIPAAFLALGCLLFAACSAAPAASGPSPSASAAPGVTGRLTEPVPGHARPVQAVGPRRRGYLHGRPLVRLDRGWLRLPPDRRRAQARGHLSRRLDPAEVAARAARARRLCPQPGGRHRDGQGQRGDGHGIDLPDRIDHPCHRGPRPLDGRRGRALQRVARYLARLARDDRRTNPDRALRPDRDRAALAGALGRARLDETDLRDESRPKCYLLTMYPYPSGDLHIGHWYIVTPTDALARFRRMHGYNVFFPIGFDAFGLPAENAAIKSGVHPFTWTMQNIETMRRQFRTMGAMFDWDDRGRHRRPRLLPLEPVALPASSSRPAWPTGRCRRSTGAPTTGRWRASRSRAPTAAAGAAARWSRSATSSSGSSGRPHYADELLDFDGHRLAGADPDPADELDRPLRGRRDRLRDAPPTTTSPAATSSASSRPARTRCSAPRSWSSRRSTRWSSELTAPGPARPRSRRTSPRRAGETEIERLSTDREKTGVAARRRRDQPGQRRADPDLHRRLRAVRLRHRRDHGRARPRRARLRVRAALRAADPAGRRRAGRGRRPRPLDAAFIAHAAGERAGQQRPLRRHAGRRGRRGDRRLAGRDRAGPSRKVTYRLRDWLISRQRYWGTPIPVIYCETRRHRAGAGRPAAGPAAGDRRLPRQRRQPAQPRRGVPATSTCPTCGGRRGARPTRWTRSSTRPGTGSATCRRTSADGPVDPEMVERWTPVDQYTGGAEHAVMHLLYSRFFTKAMADLGLIDRARAVPAAVQPGPDPGRRRRADDEVARQRPGPGRAGPALRRRHGPPVPDVHGPVGPGRTVEPDRDRRRPSVPEPGLDARPRPARPRARRPGVRRPAGRRDRGDAPGRAPRRRPPDAARRHRRLRGVPLQHDDREADGAVEHAVPLPRHADRRLARSGTRRSACCC